MSEQTLFYDDINKSMASSNIEKLALDAVALLKDGAASGGGSANLQAKSVNIYDNGSTEIIPDTGYDGMSKVTAVVSVQPILESLTATENGNYMPSGQIDGFGSVFVNVPQSSANLQSKSVTIAQEGTTTISPDSGYDGMSSVAVDVDLSSLGTKSITQNGTYNASDDSLDGYSKVSVNVASAGDYTADDWLDQSKPVGDIRSSVYSVTGQFGDYAKLLRRTNIGWVIIENSPWVESAFASYSSITLFSGYKTHSVAGNAFQNCGNLTVVELGSATAGKIANQAFAGCGSLGTLVLRSTSVKALDNTSVFNSTPFKSGGAGGTIYIPKALYDHLGDGTADDYKAATNWSTIDGYGTITWKSIESTHTDPNAPIDLTLYYADETAIPTT